MLFGEPGEGGVFDDDDRGEFFADRDHELSLRGLGGVVW